MLAIRLKISHIAAELLNFKEIIYKITIYYKNSYVGVPYEHYKSIFHPNGLELIKTDFKSPCEHKEWNTTLSFVMSPSTFIVLNTAISSSSGYWLNNWNSSWARPLLLWSNIAHCKWEKKWSRLFFTIPSNMQNICCRHFKCSLVLVKNTRFKSSFKVSSWLYYV